MPRTAEDPSGPKLNCTIKLSPRHIADLDRLVERADTNRSKVVARLIERATEALTKKATT